MTGIIMKKHWHERPTTEITEYDIETPLGILRVQPTADGFTLNAKMPEVVTINRIHYLVSGHYTLNLREEAWYGYMYPRRAYFREHTQEWLIARESAPTDAARKAVKVVDEAFKQWAEDNFNKILTGHHQAQQVLLEKAHHRLDNIIEDVQQRRQELAKLKEKVDAGGDLTQEERSLLEDLWGHRWRF